MADRPTSLSLIFILAHEEKRESEGRGTNELDAAMSGESGRQLLSTLNIYCFDVIHKRPLQVQRSANVEAPGCVNAAVKLRQML